MSALHKNTFGGVDSIRQNCLIGITVVNDPELIGFRKAGSFCGSLPQSGYEPSRYRKNSPSYGIAVQNRSA